MDFVLNKELAVSLIKESCSRGSSTPCPWTADRDAYFQEKCAALLSAVIEPVPAVISGEAFGHAGQQVIEGAVFAIARSGANWLLYAPKTDCFALAFGDRADGLTALGFSSNDALAEWLG